jgi:hypothetical protein
MHCTIERRPCWMSCALHLLFSILISPLVVILLAGSSKSASAAGTMPPATKVEETHATKPKRNLSKRIKVAAGKSVELVPGDPIVSATVNDSKIATAEITGGKIIVIKGLVAGKTTVLVVGKTKRITYGIEVESLTQAKGKKRPEEKKADHPDTTTGSHSFVFTPGFNGGPSFLRHTFDYSSKLQPGRTLRMSGDFFKIFDLGKHGVPIPPGRRFGPNRMTFGVETASTRLDLLDSQLDISQMGLTGYALRGLHLTATRESRLHGLEVFAGTARPQVSFFKRGEGRIAGAIVPIVQSKTLRIRAAAMLIAPNHPLAGSVNPHYDSPLGSPVVQTDLRYVPNEQTNIEAELAHSKGGLSWRTKLDLHRGPFNLYGELARLDETSPLIVIGAQSGGRQGSLFNGQWRPNSRFTAAVSYSRNTVLPPTRIKRLQFNSALLLATISFAPIKSARLGFILNNYINDSPAPPQLPFLLKLETNSLIVKYDQTVTSQWANELEVQIILNREGRTEAQMGNGLSIREQLRYASKRGSITGLGSYRSNTPSWESLVLQNPGVLPLEFRQSFGRDPSDFFLRNRKTLPVLLNGLNRPLSQNWDFGLRMQRTLSRLNLSGEASYSTSTFMIFKQRTLMGSVNAQLTLDPANSLQVTASRLMGLGDKRRQTALSIGYVYRFGAGSGGGFQFSRLLGRGR